jgi:glycosyltransferase involved in cell wall biosynthesis
MRVRILILIAKDEAAGVPEAARTGEMPRHEYMVLEEALHADRIDFSHVRASKHRLVRLARRISPQFGLAALGFVRRREFDRFYCSGEDVSIPFGVLMLAAFDLDRVTTVIHNGGTRKRRVLYRLIPKRVWEHIICLSREQYRVLVDDLKFSPNQVHQSPQWLDTEFYNPELAADASATGYVFACGRESRDYETLQAAAEGLDIPFHVVASGWSPSAGFATTDAMRSASNITVEAGGLSYRELRDRYHNARLVVVPVREVTYAAGVTSICEGMSMGKAIIATSSPGTRDYVHEGESGIVVPVGDVTALREAIIRLWNDTEACARFGARNRAFAVDTLRVELYAASVARLFDIRS